MVSLYTLVTKDTRLRHFFVHIGAYPYLSFMQYSIKRQHDRRNDNSMLLSACRQALVSIEENAINDVGKELSYMLKQSCQVTAPCFAEAAGLWARLYMFLWKK